MDAHFNEYLAAVAGMTDVYGTAVDEHRVVEGCETEPAPVGTFA